MSDLNSNSFARGMQALADNTADQRPSVGKHVVIDSGKHKGKSGIVVWHGVDKYAGTRYSTDAQLMLREIIGRYGYRIGVKLDDGGDRVFVNADKVTVVPHGDYPFNYDADCPICLRHQYHTIQEHEAAIERATRPADDNDMDGVL